MKALWLFWRQLRTIDFGVFYLGYVLSVLYLLAYMACKKRLENRGMIRFLAWFRGVGIAGACVWWGWFIISLTVLHPISKTFEVYLIPFDPRSWLIDGGAGGFHERRLLNAILNVLLFIPLGALLCCLLLHKKRIAIAVFLGVALAVGIELAQFVMQSGEVLGDEVLFRALGGWLGASLGSWISKPKERRA